MLLTRLSILPATLFFAFVMPCDADVAVAEKANAAKLLQISDTDNKGNIESIRTEFKFDEQGRRTGNKVVDARERLLATEIFKYDAKGRLKERTYRTGGKQLKWKWNNIKHSARSLPIRNDIVNSKGKRIGWYVWKYKDGKLSQRERFNANGSLRFYYSDIKFDKHGNYTEWTKFDSKGRKIGTKSWKFTKQD